MAKCSKDKCKKDAMSRFTELTMKQDTFDFGLCRKHFLEFFEKFLGDKVGF